MAFNLRNFVMKTLKGMKESEPEYKVLEYALKWYSKGVLTNEDMVEIDSWYEVGGEPEEVIDEEPAVNMGV